MVSELASDSEYLKPKAGFDREFSSCVFVDLSTDFLLNLCASDFLLLLLDRPFGLELCLDLLFSLLFWGCSFEFLARFAKLRLPEIDGVFFIC